MFIRHLEQFLSGKLTRPAPVVYRKKRKPVLAWSACPPLQIRSVLDQPAIKVRRSVSPPNGPTFAQTALCQIDLRSRLSQGVRVVARITNSSPTIHKSLDQFGSLLGQQVWI